MKKFLSLLLAMTMVMSLIVLPARAADGDFKVTATAGTPAKEVSVVKAGTPVTFTATAPSDHKVGTETATVKSRVWAVNNTVVAGQTAETLSQTFDTANSYTVSCTFTLEYGTDENKQETTVTKFTSITVYDCASAVTGVIFSGRPYTEKSGNKYKVYYDSAESNDLSKNEKWGVTLKSAEGYSLSAADDCLTYASGKLTAKIKYKNLEPESVEIPIETIALVAPSGLTANPNSDAKTGTKVTFTLTAATSSNTNIAWTYKASDASNATAFTPTKNTTTGNYEWMIPDSFETKTYTITCSLSESGAANTAVSKSVDISVKKDTNKFNYNPNVAATRGSTVNLSLTFTDEKGNKIEGALNNVNWNIASGTGANLGTAQVSDGKTASNTLTIPSNASNSYTVTAKFNTGGKDYVATYTVTVKSLTAAISPIQNNTAVTLYGYNYGYNYGYGTTNNLVALAQAALKNSSINATASYVTLDTNTGYRTNCYIQQTSSASGYYTYTITGTSIGTASFTGTVYTTNSSSYPITFTATVTPISTTYEAQYPEPVSSSYGNTYKYYVQVPVGASYYYVVGTPNQAITPTDFSQSGKTVYYTTTQSTSLYALTDANFVNGQCTLWIVTKNSSDNKLYYGQLTVYQKNHDIKYNGVVGGTVQFKHNDFTTFMNEMYGTNTTSYLTFNSVKFTSVPNATTQGTLYYNGVAMTTGYGSNYFNTSTAVTNLDNVSFSVSSRVPSTTKEIRIPFTLYATRYNSYGTSAGTSVTYSGVVVISLVREDVTFTVAPGDSVRFTDSAFLTYLRSASGINYNYNIDYVTFDQSAVNALNEGVLYAYSTGFNAVKTTDRFYYTTTSYNQNALSDVTFRASTYAKTGTTVYIPFTIYAKYGTSSATRQVTGTVAIKIAQTMNFVDVKTSDYFYDSVKWAVNDNITKGTSATTFSPNSTCTRAEIVTFLWRAAGSPTPTITRNPFTDVKYSVGSDFYNAILWASQNGIAAGTSTTTFAPNDNCTRAQIVTFLWRYAKKPLGYYTNPFNDVNKTEYAAYYDAILWAAGKGIATGNTPKTFDPDGTCTRAEAVTFLYRYESTK